MSRFAYADPPYLGLAQKFYGRLHPEAHIYDTLEGHRALIERMEREFPDGWAMSLGSRNLRDILPICPPDARVGSWVKTFCAFKNISPSYAWEPVIFKTTRSRPKGVFRRDWIACPMAMRVGFKGSKPLAFCEWVFNDLLGMDADDELVDLFPGSGSVSKAFEFWKKREPQRLLHEQVRG